MNRRITALQAVALPLGQAALFYKSCVERETGVEPATSTLARSHSTTELFPPSKQREFIYSNTEFVNIKFTKIKLPVLFIPVCHKGINPFIRHMVGCKFF